MDAHLPYYKEETKQVERVYLGSQFMGHGAANNIMNDFKKVYKEFSAAINGWV